MTTIHREHPRRACTFLLPGVPHRGWHWEDVYDTGEAESFCESCGKTDIRYVHFITHDEHPERLEVGCVCVKAMTKQGEEAKAAETALRNLDKRIKGLPARVAKLTWTRTQNGNLKTRFDGRLILIKTGYGAVRVAVKKPDADIWRSAERRYPSVQAAKDAIVQSLLQAATLRPAP